MSAIFITKGHAHLGMTRRDGNGNIIERVEPRFETADDGPCIGIARMNPDTMEIEQPVEVFGDYDITGYLERVAELLGPARRTSNMPDLKTIFRQMKAEGVRICDYCDELKCSNCAIQDWLEDDEEKE